MNKTEATQIFRENILPDIIAHENETNGRPDKPARRQAWNDFTDGLARDGDITEKQRMTWLHPAGLETWRRAPILMTA